MLTDTPLSVADVLEAPGAWIQGWFARDAIGTDLAEFSYEATCWCARGVIYSIAGVAGDDAVNVLVGVIGGERIYDVELWNDAPERTQPEVVAALRRAATLARAGDA
jgi:hypothetical protein